MKKQIFILTLFTLALVAGTTKVFAQPYATPFTSPQAVSCTPDELHPTAGVPYTYTLDPTPDGGTWTWWATKNPAFVTNGVLATDSLIQNATQLLNTSSSYGTASASNSVTITWSDAILAGTTFRGDGVSPNGTPTFVVGYYAAPSADCSDNIKVYELDPVNAFVVDILAIDSTDISTMAYGFIPEQCVDEVQSAVYSGGTILYDYGVNYLYYEFVAANFTGYWVPTFTLSGQNASQTISYEYTYSHPNTWGTTAPTWSPLVSGTTQILVDNSVTTTEDGVSVFVRVKVENNGFETLSDQTLVLALDGQNSLGVWDVVNSTCAEQTGADQNDQASQIIEARPTVIEGTTSPTAPNTDLINPAP